MRAFHYNAKSFVLRAAKWTEISDKAQLKHSNHLATFDRELLTRWESLMASGTVFRFNYSLNDVRLRKLEDKERREDYLIEFNPARFSERRPPQRCVELQQPFDESLFNFSKVKATEVLFNLQFDVDFEPCETENGRIVEQRESEPVELDGNSLMINNAPLTWSHCIFVPSVSTRRNQVLRRDTLEFMIHLLLLSAHPGFRVCYNSLCAYASVNHEHVHTWYTAQPLRCDSMQVSKTEIDGVQLTADSPIVGFVFELNLSEYQRPKSETNAEFDMLKLGRLCDRVYQLIALLLERNVPHNLTISRKCSDDNVAMDTVRVVVWPRKSVIRSQQVGNSESHEFLPVACAELAGHLVLPDSSLFESTTVEQLRSSFSRLALSAEQITAIKEEFLQRCASTV